MLRAGKKIEIMTNLSSQQGFIMAPIINLGGLILRADKAIPTAIQTFLEQHNIQVYRVAYKGTPCIRLRGTWELSQAKIRAFLQANPELAQAQTHNLEAVPVAHPVATEIQASITELEEQQGMISHYTRGYETEHPLPMRSSPTNISILAPSATVNRPALLLSRANIEIDAQKIKYAGDTLPTSCQNCGDPNCAAVKPATEVGIFKVLQAEQDITLESQAALLSNTLLQAGNVVSFRGRDQESVLYLSIDEQRVWLNNPHTALTFKF